MFVGKGNKSISEYKIEYEILFCKTEQAVKMTSPQNSFETYL